MAVEHSDLQPTGGGTALLSVNPGSKTGTQMSEMAKLFLPPRPGCMATQFQGRDTKVSATWASAEGLPGGPEPMWRMPREVSRVPGAHHTTLSCT